MFLDFFMKFQNISQINPSVIRLINTDDILVNVKQYTTCYIELVVYTNLPGYENKLLTAWSLFLFCVKEQRAVNKTPATCELIRINPNSFT